MQDKIKSVANKIPQKVTSLVNLLLKDEAISGKLLLAAAVLAMVAVNSPLKHVYDSLWQTQFSLGLGNFVLTEDLRHWVNDGLMAIFFLVVGLEIKREVVKGELRRPGAAVLPIAAAIGGMIVPALIFLAFNLETDAARGWGIPVATDIAFAIGVLALIGTRLPSSLRIFLLTLAIVDDLLAIVIIAVFYTHDIHLTALLVAFGLAGLLLIMRKLRPHSIVPYILIGIALWIAVKESGVHATIAGALVGFLAPIKTKEGISIAERLERAMIPVSTFLVVPLFAFANAAIVLAGIQLNSETWPIAAGIALGLVFGKVFGILGATFIITKFKLAQLPVGAHWRHMIGVGLLAGIGFTVSIFITELAFTGNETYIAAAKLGIFAASILAACGGAAILLFKPSKNP
jgi:Na+:H+ antiporter, NhaA family